MPCDAAIPWRGLTGRGVRIGIVDSGVFELHPHVGAIAGGAGIDEACEPQPDYIDRLGHGTAVTAAIKEKAPDAQLYAVRVFDRALSTTVPRIVKAIEWAADAGVHVINLSLGTRKHEHHAAFTAAVAYAAARGTTIVAACDDDSSEPWLPGSLPGVIGVAGDWECPRDSFMVGRSASGRLVCRASSYPREIPGVPPARNLKGISFAVANLTGFVARALEAAPQASSAEIVAMLEAGTVLS